MTVHSYKHYLRTLEQKSKPGFRQKLIIATACLIVIVASIASTLIYQYQKEAPLRAQHQYLDTANSGFLAARGSLEEVLLTFKIAGVKTEIVDTLKETSTPSAGFTVSLDDIDKTLLNLKTTSENVKRKKNLLETTIPPPDFEQLHNALLAFYDQTANLLEQLHQDQLFARAVASSVGPNLYLAVLSDETLWKSAQKADIANYYQQTKNDANTALSSLARLSPPEQFVAYYQTQIAYLELLVKVCDDVINTLSVEDETDTEVASQLEKAYGKLNLAKIDNEPLSQKLLAERLKLTSLKSGLNKFAPILIQQNSIDEKIEQSYNQLQAPSDFGFRAPNIFVNWPSF